jgi:hypothetical protein
VAADNEAGPSYEEIAAGIRLRRERYLAVVAAAREKAARKEATHQMPTASGNTERLDRLRARGSIGKAA